MILKNATIINHDETIQNGYIEIKNGKIVNMGTSYEGEGIDLQGKYILPGFIDIHIHGGFGHDVMDGTKEALDALVSNLPSEGTTSFLATTLTMSQEKLKAVVKTIADYESDVTGSTILGIHLEGPYVNCAFKGAQNESFIQVPTKESLQELLDVAKGKVKSITYAPELASTDFTDFLVENNIVPSCGHSAASMDEVLTHQQHGLKNITHFHNGQSPHHHRTPGVVSAGLYSDDISVELIVDGIHVSKDAVKLTHKIKSKDRIYLITDSMRAKGLEDGVHDLGGLDVIKKDNEVRTLSGSLAGSILELDNAARNMKSFTDCSINEIVSMTSYNQAQMLKLDNLGKIAKDYQADFVVLDQDLHLEQTYIKGVLEYNKN